MIGMFGHKNITLFAKTLVIVSLFLSPLLCGVEDIVFEDEEEEKKVNPCGDELPLTLAEAIQYTLQNQNRIKIAFEEVNRQKGITMEFAGPFDSITSFFVENTSIENSQNPIVATKKSGELTSTGISESKQFRVGTRVEVNAEINQVKDPANFPIPYNEGSFNIGITQPLLQGFIYSLEATDELASKQAYKAVYYDSLHSISGQILDATINYWNVVEAQKLLEIQKQSVENFEYLYNKTKRLVEKNEMAQSDLNQPLANLATARTRYVRFQQLLYARMQLLKLSIGLVPTQCISSNLYKAVDDFPEEQVETDLCRYMNLLVSTSFLYRNDLIALAFRKNEAQYLLKGANNQLLPELDVYYRYDANNFQRGRPSRKYLSAYDINRPRQSNTVGISFSMPFCNDEAKGRYRRISADLNMIIFRTLDLQKDIISEVQELWLNAQRLLIELKESQIAVERFSQLVKDENRRLSEGFGSLFNLIDFQNRLTDSQEVHIGKQRDFAETIARIRFAIGLIVRPDSTLCYLNVQDVRTLPTFEEKMQ